MIRISCLEQTMPSLPASPSEEELMTRSTRSSSPGQHVYVQVYRAQRIPCPRREIQNDHQIGSKVKLDIPTPSPACWLRSSTVVATRKEPCAVLVYYLGELDRASSIPRITRPRSHCSLLCYDPGAQRIIDRLVPYRLGTLTNSRMTFQSTSPSRPLPSPTSRLSPYS
jgi:hypothetical protein